MVRSKVGDHCAKPDSRRRNVYDGEMLPSGKKKSGFDVLLNFKRFLILSPTICSLFEEPYKALTLVWEAEDC